MLLKAMSWFTERAKPQPIEAEKNSMKATIYAFRLPKTSDKLVNNTAKPRSQRAYAKAIQFIFDSESKSVPIVNKAVLTIELSRNERNKPRQSLRKGQQLPCGKY